MPRLKAANNARTVLTQAVGVSDTTIYVEDVSKFPAPPFRITVDNEIMEVTAVDPDAKAFTVMRAQENTVAASHLAGAVVENRWTAGTYNELLSQADLTWDNIQGKPNFALASDLAAHQAKTASINAIGHVYAAEFTATLSTSWSGSAPPYTQTITINGITSAHNPIIDVVMSGTYSTDQQRIEQWGYIYRAVTGANTITFYASEKPTISLPIRVKVVG